MRLVYGGDFFEHGSCVYRRRAMERLGFTLFPFDFAPYMAAGGPLARRVRVRLLVGRQVERFNRDLLAFVAEVRPAVVWLDKPVFLWPETVTALQALGAVVVNYITDNPYGTLFEPWFRLTRRTIPVFDVNIVPRPSSVADFTRAGAGRVVLMPFAFDPVQQFPVPVAEVARTVPVSFIGAPYDNRPRFLAALAATGQPVLIRGERWHRHLPRRVANITFGPLAWSADYRRAIQDSAICLSFVTHHNHDPYAHKSFEITACGSLLLAERTPGHAALFEEGREAAFFGSVAEAAEKCRFLLGASQHREDMARAGCRRAWRSGYSNDERIAAAFTEIDPPFGRLLAERARVIIAGRRAELGLD